MSKYHFPVSPQAKACNCPLVTITSCINSSKLKLSIILRAITVRYFVLLQTNKLACCCSQMLAEDRRHLHLDIDLLSLAAVAAARVSAFASFLQDPIPLGWYEEEQVSPARAVYRIT